MQKPILGNSKKAEHFKISTCSRKFDFIGKADVLLLHQLQPLWMQSWPAFYADVLWVSRKCIMSSERLKNPVGYGKIDQGTIAEKTKWSKRQVQPDSPIPSRKKNPSTKY